MAETASYPATTPVDRGERARPTVQALPVTPGKVAMWLFLATEVMFFTGLIGSYIVLRAGSPPTSYSELYPPEEALEPLMGTWGTVIDRVGLNPKRVASEIESAAGLSAEEAEALVEHASENPQLIKAKLDQAGARGLEARLKSAGATARAIEQT